RAAGIEVAVSSAETIAICRDKRRFNAFCHGHGFPIPQERDPHNPNAYPLFLRTRTGAGGSGACGATSVQQAVDALDDPDNWLFQELVEAPEYTVDVVCDLDGRPLQAVARLRQQVKAGEAVRSIVDQKPELLDLA